MKGRPIIEARGRSRKTINKTIMKELDSNALSTDMVCDRTQIASFSPCSRLHLVRKKFIRLLGFVVCLVPLLEVFWVQSFFFFFWGGGGGSIVKRDGVLRTFELQILRL